MYVDESGDPGAFTGSNSPHFILIGLIVPVDEWNVSLQRLVKLRKEIRKTTGLSEREEIHSSELIRINKIEAYRSIPKQVRISILKTFVTEIPVIFPGAKIICVCLDKQSTTGYQSFQELAWKRLIQRYDTFLKKKNSKGIIVADDSDEPVLRALLRKMRVYNPVPSKFSDSGFYNPVITNVVEDIFFRESKHSFVIQAVDAIAQALYRKEYPKGSLKKFGLQYLFDTLDPLLLKEASPKDPQGIVRG
jgi:hypothetical protein